MPDLPFLGYISYDPKVVEADLSGIPPYQENPTFLQSMGGIVDQLSL
jgi:CO dehydrogenase nickel-insertion accessory protein CooC1